MTAGLVLAAILAAGVIVYFVGVYMGYYDNDDDDDHRPWGGDGRWA